MSDAEQADYTVLFADISGSMTLYQSAGDDDARRLVIGLQEKLTETVQSHKGVVQEIIGDEIMARFRQVDSALLCASSIHQHAEQFSQKNNTTIQMRIGLHTGSAIVDEDRMFGDTVNLAARVAAIATAGQTIITAASLTQATPYWNTRAHHFDTTKVKGKSEAIDIYLLPWREDEMTTIKQSPQNVSSAGRLTLSYGDTRHELKDASGTFSLGRALTNDLVVDAEPVSRRHTSIECIRGRYVVTDNSTNGTHVYMSNGEVIYLRRQQLPIWGSGQLALGAPSDQAAGHVIDFTVDK